MHIPPRTLISKSFSLCAGERRIYVKQFKQAQENLHVNAFQMQKTGRHRRIRVTNEALQCNATSELQIRQLNHRLIHDRNMIDNDDAKT